MGDLEIVIKNKSDEVQQFLIFNDVPAFSQNAGKAWTNVWGCSPGVGAESGNTTFGIHERFFAVCGMQKKPLATDLTVQISDYEAVKLGTDKIKATMVAMKIEDKGAVFDKHATKEFEKNGSFGINTSDYDMTGYKHAFCGLGMKSPVPEEEDVVPVAVWQAKPNQDYHITPKRVYYISTGKFHAGLIVDVAKLGQTATVDFTGRKETVATVCLNNQLSYEPVQYSFGSD
ncbi:MAG: hypothetical protein Q9176_006917 [Flavoplaca citrina]